MTWRPKGWKNPFLEASGVEAERVRHDYFEAGADAMLEALRKEGYVKFDKLCPYCGASTRLECGFCSCNRYPIEIPDEEESND